MRIRLDDERRELVLARLAEFWRESFDEELSPYRAERLLDLFLRELGPPLYNQAIQDARGFMLEKLEDLDGELYEPEETG